MDCNELVLEVLQDWVVNGKLALQGTVGDPTVLLQHSNRLAEDFVERHGGSSTYEVAPQCASPAAYHTRTSEKAEDINVIGLEQVGYACLRCHVETRIVRQDN